MHKPAETRFGIHPLIRDRWSPVCFSPKRIEPEILGSLFEAARWAPSSFNEQPWTFCIATQDQPAEFAALLGCLMDANQVWAKQAYVLIITVSKLALDRNAKPNRHCYDDTGSATQNLILQAMSHGVFCHPMGGFDGEKARSVLSIPATHEPLTAIAVGYPVEDVSGLDAGLRQRDQFARSRKPLSDIVFTGKFGRADRRF
jgi:nitroreductase